MTNRVYIIVGLEKFRAGLFDIAPIQGRRHEKGLRFGLEAPKTLTVHVVEMSRHITVQFAKYIPIK